MAKVSPTKQAIYNRSILPATYGSTAQPASQVSDDSDLTLRHRRDSSYHLHSFSAAQMSTNK